MKRGGAGKTLSDGEETLILSWPMVQRGRGGGGASTRGGSKTGRSRHLIPCENRKGPGWRPFGRIGFVLI
jgi:hypothetical protein